jgi:hypothetical protein
MLLGQTELEFFFDSICKVFLKKLGNHLHKEGCKGACTI